MLQSDETAVADNRAVGGEAACVVLRTQRHHEVTNTLIGFTSEMHHLCHFNNTIFDIFMLG